jgi:hypothetical protein
LFKTALYDGNKGCELDISATLNEPAASWFSAAA